MLPPALRRHIANRPLQHLQQGLLHSLARHIPRDTHILRLLPDLVDLINVDDPHLRSPHIEIRRLQQPQHNVLHVLTHITSLRQGRRIRNAERHPQHLR